MFDANQLYHFPEVPSGAIAKNMPEGEPYIRFRCSTKTQTYEKNPETGEIEAVVKSEPNDHYYWPIGPMRYDTISETGSRAIMDIIKRRELRGHRVDCFGNFPQTKYWILLAKQLKNTTGLALKNPEHPIRLAVEAEMKDQIAALKGGEGKSVSELEKEIAELRAKLHANQDKQEQAEGRPESEGPSSRVDGRGVARNAHPRRAGTSEAVDENAGKAPAINA